nr:MAG TPA: hypothetical protein [Bacteriophage sp.]
MRPVRASAKSRPGCQGHRRRHGFWWSVRLGIGRWLDPPF